MIIYCDGSAYPNPGPGGFGVIVLDKSKKLVYHIHRESSENTTNNREELKAILYCLKKFGGNVSSDHNDDFLVNIPIVYSDSAYAINTYTNWMFSWAENDWNKSDNQKPENLDIIQEYYKLFLEGYRIDLQKIKGHSGDFWHDFADNLAANRLPLWRLKNE